jgi:hypothetical protein
MNVPAVKVPWDQWDDYKAALNAKLLDMDVMFGSDLEHAITAVLVDHPEWRA